MGNALMKRLGVLERVLGAEESQIAAIFVSIVDSRAGGQLRDDEADCVGLTNAQHGDLERLPGESLSELDARASAMKGQGAGVPVWLRKYREAVE